MNSDLEEKRMMKTHAAAAAVSILSGLFVGGMGFSASNSPVDPTPTPGSYCSKTGTTASILGNMLGATAPCDATKDACLEACTGNPLGPGSFKVLSVGEDKCTQPGAPECSDVTCTRYVYFDAACSNLRTSNTFTKEACL